MECTTDGIGYSGHTHQKGEKIIAITDNHGYVLEGVQKVAFPDHGRIRLGL